jgi:MFS family permease
MSNEDTEDSASENRLTLSKMVRERYEMFTVMGIFGAVAVYLSTLSGEVDLQNQTVLSMGIVASLLIFIILSIDIAEYLLQESQKEAEGVVEEIKTLFFTLLFAVLIFSVLYTAYQADTTSVNYVSAILGFGLGVVVFTTVPRISDALETKLQDYYPRALEKIGISTESMSDFLTSTVVFSLFIYLSQSSELQMPREDPLTAIFVSFVLVSTFSSGMHFVNSVSILIDDMETNESE